jgi:hypothetical protein
VNTIGLLVISSLLSFDGDVKPNDREAAAILELGAAPAWNLKDGAAALGPTVALEITPIEKWLELEAGVTQAFSRHGSERDIDLLFKKPWNLSKKAELMFGAGPAWVRSKQSGVVTNAFAGEVVLDFMFWPTAKRRFGWYIEPAYEYTFGREHERSIGISAGLLIAIR